MPRYYIPPSLSNDKVKAVSAEEPNDVSLPERDLVAAVLITAINDLSVPQQIERRRAIEFFYSDKMGGELLTFLDCCEILDLNPDVLLQRLSKKLPARIVKFNRRSIK
jgi:hypothetical protein